MKRKPALDPQDNILDAIFIENEIEQDLELATFDEVSYLEANPDVVTAIWSGDYLSGQDHYTQYGRAEGRLTRIQSDSLPGSAPALNVEAETPRTHIDVVLSSTSGYFLIVGWSNDKLRPIERVLIQYGNSVLGIPATSVIRHRRGDVENALAMFSEHDFGFWIFHKTGVALKSGTNITVVLLFADGTTFSNEIKLKVVSEQSLQQTCLSHLNNVQFFGNRMVELSNAFDRSVGLTLVRHNLDITAALKSGIFVERFGENARRIKASIVVCLYGKAEFMFVQSALFSQDADFRDYEFIYVSNSPELADSLRNSAKICSIIYNISIVLIVLPGNLGFGGANNIAANFSRSDRIIFMNPDVFPMTDNWSKLLSNIEDLPEAQQKIFGASLFYDDGSLMHGGMYFEVEAELSMGLKGATTRDVIRVEHYGKGAPPSHLALQMARPVPAVTGAFIGVHRSWFEQLNGFTEDFVFGHYEDADLCLKSMLAGRAPWLHPLPLWHLEGKGSNRRPEHEGGSLVNRWLFAQKWLELLKSGMTGQAVDVEARTAALSIQRWPNG